MRVAAFAKYDREAASTRQRILQYLPWLARGGIHVDVHPLLDDAYVRSLASGHPPSKAQILQSYARRFGELRGARNADLLWVYAELFPWLPAPFEQLAFSSGKAVLYDYDDAFFHTYDDHRRPLMRRMLGGKLDPLITGATAVCAGNDYLCDHAIKLNPNSIVLPTVVDIDQYRPAARRTDRPLTIGWIGSPTTWSFVRPYLPMLAQLCRTFNVRISVVGAGASAEADRFDGLIFTKWSEASEIASVQAMDIGIMPLPDESWARGKSGYKLIQYMACGLPLVGSPVGVNVTIVKDGVTGFLASTVSEWHAALERLLADSVLRSSMGRAGRARAVEEYSLQSQAPRLIEIMRSAVARGRTIL